MDKMQEIAIWMLMIGLLTILIAIIILGFQTNIWCGMFAIGASLMTVGWIINEILNQ